MAASSETAPLLRQASISKANNETPNGYLQDYDTIPAHTANDDLLAEAETTWKYESKLLAQYSTPLVVTYVLQ